MDGDLLWLFHGLLQRELAHQQSARARCTDVGEVRGKQVPSPWKTGVISALTLGVILAAPFGGCGPSDNSEETSVATDLEDGTYSCDATNLTRASEPYTLECEKSGESLVLRFPNGGYITLDIDSQDTTDGHFWEIQASHAETGDSWDLTIQK